MTISARAVWLARGVALALSVVLPLAAWAADETVEKEREAAAAGDAAALYRLGERYERADGVEQDFAMAAAHMRLAAERGHPPAQYRVGLFYAGGLGVAEDPVESYKWLTLAGAAEGAVEEVTLLAAALRGEVAKSMSEADIARARDKVAAFAPVKGPAELPLPGAGGQAEAAPSLASLRRYLPPGNCGRLTVDRSDDGGFRVAGYLDESDPSGGFSAAAMEYFARARVDFQVARLGPGLCRVIRQVASDPARLEGGFAVTLRDQAGKTGNVFADGAYIITELTPLAAERYVAVDYFAHDGNVLHMFPRPGVGAGRVPAGRKLVLGDPEAGGDSWQIGPPFGKDLLVAFVSERPLYEAARPQVEAIADYLAFLGRRLTGTAPGEGVQVRYRVIETVPR